MPISKGLPDEFLKVCERPEDLLNFDVFEERLNSRIVMTITFAAH